MLSFLPAFKRTMRFALFLLFTFFIFARCSSPTNPSASTNNTEPVVLVTIAPYQYLVNRIASDKVKTVVLVPAGVNPHAYEPSPQEASLLPQARLWFFLGEAVDLRLQALYQNSAHSPVTIDLKKGLPLLPVACSHSHLHKKHSSSATSDSCSHETSEFDLHIWLSPRLLQEQATTITTALCQILPENSTLFHNNLLQLVEELKQLDQFIVRQQEKKADINAIAVSHPAFGYFCRDYNLKQIAIEQEGHEPTVKEIGHLIEKLQKNKVRCIYLQKQYNNKAACMVADLLHLPVAYVDPYQPNCIEGLKELAQMLFVDESTGHPLP